MSEKVTLAAEIRSNVGTGVSRNARNNGMVPATVYGNNKEPMSVLVQEKEITKLYRKHGFKTTIVELDIAGAKYLVMPKTVQLHPITDIVRHVDFMYLSDSVQRVDVPIKFEGRDRSLGLKRGGFFNIIFRSVPLFCEVNKIPTDIVIDIVNMGIGTSIRASSLNLPEGCKLVSKKDFIIASITGRGGKSDAAEEGAAPAAA